MMHSMKYSKSLLVPSLERMVVSHVGGRVSAAAAAAAAMGSSRRFFYTGGIATESLSSSSAAASLMNGDMFRAGGIPNMFRGRGRPTGGCVGSFVPPQCSKSHMLPYFARSLVSSSVSQSSGQTQWQEPKKQRKECQIISSELQRERCDEISSTEVSLNQFPRLMVHGNGLDSETRRLLRLNPDTGYFEEQDVSAAASNHHGHYDLQVPHRHVCRGSAYGWLFLTNDNLDMKLLNPFSGAEIQLPPVTTLVKGAEQWIPFKFSVNGAVFSANLPTEFKFSVYKAVFSANPSIEPRPVVFIIYNQEIYKTRLAFCKPGDKGWTHLGYFAGSSPTDAIYHKGQFYVLNCTGYVTAVDIGRCINDDDDHSVKTTLIASPSLKSLCGRDLSFEPLEPKMRDSYLVVLDGELVKFELRSVRFHDSCIDETKEFLEREMNRDGDTSDEDFTDEDFFGFLNKKAENRKLEASNHEESNDDVDSDDGQKKECGVVVVDPRLYCVDPRARSCTYSIKIRRWDASEAQWVKMESLGDKAVILGFNTSFAISASDYPAGVCIPDSVYFIDGGGMDHMYEERLYDMGIYNVKDKCLKPLYPQNASKFREPAPIWIVNSTDS